MIILREEDGIRIHRMDVISDQNPSESWKPGPTVVMGELGGDIDVGLETKTYSDQSSFFKITSNRRLRRNCVFLCFSLPCRGERTRYMVVRILPTNK